MMNLDSVLKKMYDKQVNFIKKKNNEFEREYFTKYSFKIPMSELMINSSFEDHFNNFKNSLADIDEKNLNIVFMLLEDYFLFSNGHDMMFKMKLEADLFQCEPMKNFIYPMLEKRVKEKYNDVSIINENEKAKENKEGISKIIFLYIKFQALLYLLYWNDFQPSDMTKELFQDDYDEVIKMLNKSDIKIGEFLHALVDYKCDIIKDIISNVQDDSLRDEYINKTENLRKEKHEETDTFAHVKLPINYFYNHTILDFLDMPEEPKRSIILQP